MKLSQNKRGIEKGTLVLLIAVLVLAGYVLLPFSKDVAEAGTKSLAVKSCAVSVDANARLRLGKLELPTAITCPARELAISDEETANKRLAEELADCWYQYGEGKLNLFREDEGTFCTVCAFINIKTKESVKGLPDYLMAEQLPDNSGRLYYDYLSGYKTSRAEQVFGALKNPGVFDAATKNELKPGTTYAIIFQYLKGEEAFRNFVEHITLQTTAGKIGFFTGLIAAPGGAAIGAGAVMAFSGPIGWGVLIGAGVGIGVAFGVSEGLSLFLSPDNIPELASFIVVREWSGETAESVLGDELGCESFPVKLE